MRTSSERRRRDRELQRAAANRRFGHDNAYLILFGPQVFWAVVVLLLVALGVWAWYAVDHATIAGVVGAAGVLALAVYGARTARAGTLSGRLNAAATGRTSSARWHLVGASGLLMVAAAVTIWAQLP
jgi:hypothetical protein